MQQLKTTTGEEIFVSDRKNNLFPIETTKKRFSIIKKGKHKGKKRLDIVKKFVKLNKYHQLALIGLLQFDLEWQPIEQNPSDVSKKYKLKERRNKFSEALNELFIDPNFQIQMDDTKIKKLVSRKRYNEGNIQKGYLYRINLKSFIRMGLNRFNLLNSWLTETELQFIEMRIEQELNNTKITLIETMTLESLFNKLLQRIIRINIPGFEHSQKVKYMSQKERDDEISKLNKRSAELEKYLNDPKKVVLKNKEVIKEDLKNVNKNLDGEFQKKK